MTKLMNTALSQSISLHIPGGECSLTTLEEGDAKSLYDVLAIDSVSDRLIRIPKPLISRNELLALSTVAERNAAFFGQTSVISSEPLKVIRHNGRPIGCISLAPRSSEPIVEMGYYLHPAHQRKRIMREAGRKLLRYAANEFGIRKVFCSADDGNPASARVIMGIVKDTAVGEVQTGRKVLDWPVGKKVEGKSWSSTWLWNVEPEKGYES